MNKILTLLTLLSTTSTVLAGTPAEQAVFVNPELLVNMRTAQLPEAINTILNTAWGGPQTLIKPDNSTTAVDTCQTLTHAIDSGYKPTTEFYGKYIYWRHDHCKAVSYISQMKNFSTSYIHDLTLDASFPAVAPPALALIISDDDIRKAHQVATWSAMSEITRIDITDATQSTYYDASGSIQKVTVMARGDYNDDHIEDILLFVDNSVEGGSYESQDAFILTRTGPGAPLTLLKSLHPLPHSSD